ncbi:MAG: M1 family metallopeptidase [Comamonadaceae bacterium]
MGPVFKFVLLLLAMFPLWATADPAPMRLPGGVVPLSYRLTLTIDPEQDQHSGEVSIALDIKAASRVIRLHASDIKVGSAVLKTADASYIASVSPVGDKMLELAFAQALPLGQAELSMSFTGHIDDKASQGLFRQKEGGDWYVFTQFESTDARRAFPCFDEPAWKVPWTLSLIIPEKLSAVANTPLAREAPLDNGMKRLDFLNSQPLPSYLVAFGVGPFDILDAGKAGATPLRLVAPRGRAAEARYAASMTPAILASLEAYFAMSYPYDKLDLMAMPITLNFSAMENPGLVTLASHVLLARPDEETSSFRRDAVETIAHELAHQWFGNYVTMAWWDDLWLNESFASWMGDKITAQVVPEWHSQTNVQQARAAAMQLDRLAVARRIHQPVDDAEALESAFDSITYSKGQAVLAMFESWLGAQQFRAGVQRYMKQHPWGSATGDDFVAALAPGQAQLTSAFKSFTEQPGIPRLNVALVCDGKPYLQLSQSRFLPKGSSASADSVWQIPVTVRTPAGASRLLLQEPTGQLPLPDSHCPAWVEANADGAGYYRAVYAPGQLLNLLTNADLNIAEVLANLDDAQALTESGDLPLADALALALRYAADSRREVLDAALHILRSVEPSLALEQGPAYAALWQRAFGARGRALGLLERAADSDDERLIRENWVGVLADLGRDQNLRAQAMALSQGWLKDPATLAVASRGLVLSVAALDGDKAFFGALERKARSSDDRSERADIYAALSRFQSPELARSARALWLSVQHDVREVLEAASDRAAGQASASGMLDFMQQNFAALAARLPAESVSRFPRFFSGLCSIEQASSAERFFGPALAPFEGGASSLAQTLETIRLCASQRDFQQSSLSAFLARP